MGEEEVTIWRFGWLHAEYEYSLWEAAVLLRKAIIALLPAMLPGATPQTLYLCATCAFFFAILAHALLLPYSVPYAVTAQRHLVGRHPDLLQVLADPDQGRGHHPQPALPEEG